MTAQISCCPVSVHPGTGRHCAMPTPRRHLWRKALAVLLFGAGCLPLAAQTLLDQVPASLVVPDHPRVAQYAARYLSSPWRPWFERIMDRSLFYADHILRELEQRELPAELLFLPAIESEYLHHATSWVGAAGLWQLMPGTARLHGLVTDELVDERRDFWKATDVALRILRANHEELGDWALALAAYNAGLGRVRRAVQAGGADYWELRRRGLLPRETREFVPRFYGLVQAMRSFPASESPPLDELHRWRRVAVPDGIELRQLGSLTEVPIDVLERANAELRYGLTPAPRAGRPYQIKVPAYAYDRLLEVLQDSASALVRIHRHTIRSGDTMSELAEAFNVSVVLIRQYNSGVDPRRMPIGVGLHIPLVKGVDPSAVFLPEVGDPRSFEADYRVAGGDSLWRIARLYDTTVEALASANGLRPTSTLYPGQVLRVPRQEVRSAAAGRV